MSTRGHARVRCLTLPDATYLSHLFYNRDLSLAELTRAYRYLKAQWANRQVTIL